MKNDYSNEEFDEERDGKHYYNEPQPLQREQKIAAIVLAVFGVFVLIMWMAQFKKSIVSPLDTANKQDGTQQEISTCTGSNCTGNDENLRFKDTDGDSLTDYDELNVYKTSPYLEDSDSDGLRDNVEIAGEKDPNCPEGVDCYGSALLSGESEEEESAVNVDLSNTDLNTELLIKPDNISSDQEESLNQIMVGGGNADMLRQALLDFGMEAEVLNQISDEDLMASYQEILKNQ